MPRNLIDLRFVVQRADGFESSVWRAWATPAGDVYLGTRSMIAIEKISFHRSRICRRAFTAQQGAPPGLQDRLIHRWRRDPAPDPGTHTAVRVAWIAFPTDYLSRPRAQLEGKAVVRIDAAPAGGATYVELAFTRESRESVTTSFSASDGRRLVLHQGLPGDEALIVDYYHADWVNRDLIIPGDGKVRDLKFSAGDPLDTGRPVRLTLGPAPTDGNALQLQELGGYPA